MTNCGHLYCALCLQACYTARDNVLPALPCPMCRRNITLLVPVGATGNAPNDVRTFVTDYNRRHGGGVQSWMDRLRDLPHLSRAMVRVLLTPQTLMVLARVRILVLLLSTALYLLSPLDIIPEAVFGVFGLIDDAVIAIVLLLIAISMFRQVMARTPFFN